MRDAWIIAAAVTSAPPEPDQARWLRRPVRLGRIDRLSRLALLAVDEALEGGAGDAGEGLGVVVGTCFGCHAANAAFAAGLFEGGSGAASPRIFAQTLPSTPLGELAIHLGARGPVETLASGQHAGLEALGRAMRLCRDGRAETVIAVAVDEGGATLARMGIECASGATAFVVSAHRPAAGALGRVLGAASAFVGHDSRAARLHAIERAVADAGVTRAEIEVATGGEDEPGAVGVPAALVGRLRAAREIAPAPVARQLLLVAADDESGAAAALVIALAP